MKRTPLFILFTLLLFSCTPKEEQPFNVVFILIDDMGWTDTEAFGSTFYQTPHLDQLASESMRFTNGYAACPVCSPTRASILTGKYPARLKQTDWIPGRRNLPSQKLRQVEDLDYLALEHKTLANILQDAGYATAHIGKWHLGAGDEFLPENRGFALNIAGNQYGSPPSYFYPYSRKLWRDTTQVYQLTDLVEEGFEGEYLTDRLGQEAATYIKSKKDEPFFLHFSQYAVHTPLQARPHLEAKYKARQKIIADSSDFGYEGNRPVRTMQNHAVYAGMVESMDASVGMVMRAINEAGISDRTIVIFFSDNGGLSTSEGWPTSNLPLRTGKGWLYEGGIRVPMLIKWPGVTDVNQICDVPVTSVDFLPTILDMLQLEDHMPAEVDGESLTSLLAGAGEPERDALYWHYPHYSNQGGKPGGAIREGAYKLIANYEDDSVELYNLDNDLGEQNNLAASMPEKAAELQQKLDAWLANLDAQMPIPNPDFEGE